MIDQKHFSNLGSTLGGKGCRAWQKFLIDQSEKRMQVGQLSIDKHCTTYSVSLKLFRSRKI